jgi:hypothetical protein
MKELAWDHEPCMLRSTSTVDIAGLVLSYIASFFC